MNPPINTQNREEFLYKKTHIITSGSSSGLAKDFTVGKSEFIEYIYSINYFQN